MTEVGEVDAIWKIEKGLCRCCHADGMFKNLGVPCYNKDDQKYEKYSAMIKESLNIDIMLAEGYYYPMTFMICDTCIDIVRDISNFRQQVIACEDRFLQFYSKQLIEVPIKIELDSEDDMQYELVLDKGDRALPVNHIEQEYNEPTKDDEEDIADQDDVVEPLHSDGEEQALKPAKNCKSKKDKTQKKAKRKTRYPKRTRKVADSEKAEGVPQADDENGGRTKFRLKPQDYRIEDGAWVCTACEKRFKRKGDAQIHIKAVHYKVRRLFTCKFCREGFPTMTELSRHKLDKHNIDESIKCNACDKVFTMKKRFDLHIRSYHMLGERIKCELCEFEGYTKEIMYRHMYKHRTTKDYQCKFCKKSFLRKTTLAFHERIHTGDRRKVCKECGQAFVQKASLNYHMAKHHPSVKF